MSQSQPTINELCEMFLAGCRRDREPATEKFYRSRLKLFRAAYGNFPWSQLTAIQVLQNLAAAGEGRSSSTRRHNAVALETFQKWILKNHLGPRIFESLEKPRMGRREKLPLPEETAVLLQKANPAFKLIYQALRQCGARPGELCHLQISDIDFPGELITIKKHKTVNSTGKPREIPIGDKLRALLQEAIGTRQVGPVFLTITGVAWTVENLSRTYSKLRNNAGLPRHLVLYLSRHEFGTGLIRAQIPIKDVADLMGHSSVKTTERYIHRDVRELRNRQDLLGDEPPKAA